jgi:hypothetical protein
LFYSITTKNNYKKYYNLIKKGERTCQNKNLMVEIY